MSENKKDSFLIDRQIGAGTYGQVFKIIHRQTKNEYALKKIYFESAKDGLPTFAIREVSILLEFSYLNHPNIMKLLDVFKEDRSLSLVLEYYPWDLKRYLEHVRGSYKCGHHCGLSTDLLKSLGRQLFVALDFCHCRKVSHRDVKPSNILLQANGVLKLGDFGLARTFSHSKRTLCHDIVTLWYRSPEIILGCNNYSYEVDVWGAGCVLMEMVTLKPLFRGDCEIDQLFQIFKRFGTPTIDDCPELFDLPDFKRSFPKFHGIQFSDIKIPSDLISELALTHRQQHGNRHDPPVNSAESTDASHCNDNDAFNGQQVRNKVNDSKRLPQSASHVRQSFAEEYAAILLESLQKPANTLSRNLLLPENQKLIYMPGIEDFRFIRKVGHGTFGEVHECRQISTQAPMALKKLTIEPAGDTGAYMGAAGGGGGGGGEGFPITAMREIKILSSLYHENIMPLRSILCDTQSGSFHFYLVMDFCQQDLAGLLQSGRVDLNPSQRKSIAQQLLRGMAYLHSRGYIHRDLKSANILLDKGRLRIADFGLARKIIPTWHDEGKPSIEARPTYTTNVVTRWYRAPELLLNYRRYDIPIDVWAVGCILVELWSRKPLFPGQSDQDQLKVICNICGPIPPKLWREVYGNKEPSTATTAAHGNNTAPRFNNLLPSCLSASTTNNLPNVLRSIIGKDDPHGMDLILKLLVLQPNDRLDAVQALDHDWFRIPPEPGKTEYLNAGSDCFEYFNKEKLRASAAAPRKRGSTAYGTGASSNAGRQQQLQRGEEFIKRNRLLDSNLHPRYN